MSSYRDVAANLVVDGLDEAACFAGDGERAPFVVFDVNRQTNIAGPFASRDLASQHRLEILSGHPPHLDRTALSQALTAAENGKMSNHIEPPATGLNHAQQGALIGLQSALSQATDCGLFDEMAAHSHPDRINAFCDDVSVFAQIQTKLDDLAVPCVEALLNDPATSFWLKRALQGAIDRDPVDASHDAQLLAKVLAKVADQATTQEG